MKRIVLVSVTLLILFLILVTLRGWEHTLTALPHLKATCPKNVPAVLILGQSHASNTGPKRSIAWTEAYAFERGNCYYLRDPIPGTADNGGTLWPDFAERLGNPVVIANIAISGSSIETWTTKKQLLRVRDNLEALKSAGFNRPLIILMQGETNAVNRTSADEYYSHLKQLLAVAPDSRWVITPESICWEFQKKWLPLDVARNRIAKEQDNVFIGPDLDQLSVDLRQEDKCHFTVEGQSVLAAQLAKTVAPLLR